MERSLSKADMILVNMVYQMVSRHMPVSYTHLTLPTKLEV